ncbi:MAG: DUF5077 domain-containing protein [Bacteroidota bacterium]|nr:DUF5077 domain-containing protein [Bacteroidota bacterium]
MKYSLSALLSILFFSCSIAQNNTPVRDSNNISLFSNAYAYPKSENWESNNISKQGLHNWKDAQTFTRTFFYPQKTGNIQVALKLKSPDGNSKLRIQLDNTGKSYEISVDKSADFVTIPVGIFSIKDARYHYIEIKGISKTSNSFPDIESLIISGPAAENLKYNLSEYKGAPSTHLWYQYPKDSTIAWFYNEVTVPVGVDATNAYYMTNGFSGGYSGIQLNSTTERRFIFSVWSNYSTNDPKEIPADYAITLIKKGKDVFTGEFGNEGSGGHSHLVFPWKQGITYKILIGAKAKGDHTIYSCYYFAPENGKWNLMAIWDKTKTGGKLLSGLYSFVENFGPNGNDFFKADYGNQWVCTPSGTWIEMTECFLTTTASASKHQRYDYGAGVEENKFYMFTGGFKEMNNPAPHSVIKRKANGGAPNIDFAALPDK